MFMYTGLNFLSRLWTLGACLISSFAPFGRSGRVTHATVDSVLAVGWCVDNPSEKVKSVVTCSPL